MRMIFIFIDGLGIGEPDKTKNPIHAANAPNIIHILNTYTVIPTDATMDVPGLPQSATGQTAIFTGVNASKIIGHHLSGQPTETLKNVINTNNLFKELINRGYSVTNSNVYRDEYLVKMLDPKERLSRPSVTSVMTMSSGIKFRTISDYKNGKGVYHDITGEILIKSGYDVKACTPQEAAQRLYTISRDYDFTLYEHFMSDIIGHTGDMKLAIDEIELLDAFLGELLHLVNLDEDVIFITSDHGNIEDISVETHTKNKVPTIIMGKLPEGVQVQIECITDITPQIIKIFDATEIAYG